MNNKDFDPIFILYQIVALQCFFYLAMGTIWGIAHVAFETPVSLDRFFTSNYINFVTVSGWLEAFCTISSSLAGWVHHLFPCLYCYFMLEIAI